jgi:hypothetical protein
VSDNNTQATQADLLNRFETNGTGNPHCVAVPMWLDNARRRDEECVLMVRHLHTDGDTEYSAYGPSSYLVCKVTLPPTATVDDHTNAHVFVDRAARQWMTAHRKPRR